MGNRRIRQLIWMSVGRTHETVLDLPRLSVGQPEVSASPGWRTLPASAQPGTDMASPSRQRETTHPLLDYFMPVYMKWRKGIRFE